MIVLRKLKGVINKMTILINGKRMLSKEETHRYISQKLNFPDYYGKNLNALWDMLTTIHKKTTIHMYNIDYFLSHSEYKQKLIDLLVGASEENQYLDVMFTEGNIGKDGITMKFSWVTILVNDLEESLKFYQEVIGLPLGRRFKSGGKSEICFLGKGETQVELIYNEEMDKTEHTLDISLGFVVDSLDETMDMLKEKNIEIIQGPVVPNDHIKYLFILDPNGVKIQFAEMS